MAMLITACQPADSGTTDAPAADADATEATEAADDADATDDTDAADDADAADDGEAVRVGAFFYQYSDTYIHRSFGTGKIRRRNESGSEPSGRTEQPRYAE